MQNGRLILCVCRLMVARLVRLLVQRRARTLVVPRPRGWVPRRARGLAEKSPVTKVMFLNFSIYCHLHFEV